MTAVLTRPADLIGDLRLPGLCLLMFSAVVLAQTVEHSDLDVTIDELQKEEIYATAGDWRKPEVDAEEEAWRKPEPQVAEKSRMQFGYDSIYDEARQREQTTATTLDFEIEKYKPSSAFKVKF